VSIPLGSAGRAEPDIRAAIAEREALTVERESSALVLHATLAQAYDQFIAAKLTVERTRDDLLPRLAHADAASERAYRGGALSALEWAQVQTETTAARQQQLAAAIEAQRALIEIQRLTAEPLTSDSLDKEATP
jgi:cobalt-zinc-cadmium efflux system outer membrane protein